LKRFFFDMDGVLARFYEHAGCHEKFLDEGFFFGLRPYESMIHALRLLHRRSDIRVYVLSSVPNEAAASEKSGWLTVQLPDETIGCFFPRNGTNKAEYIKSFFPNFSKDDILFDDYSTNLVEWEEAGGTGVKVLNEFNGRGLNGTNFAGRTISTDFNGEETYEKICKMFNLPPKLCELSLTMMVGLPGSGKSTIAKALSAISPELKLISSDSIRQELYGDENKQGDPEEVFSLVNNRIHEALKSGTSVLYDATNLYRKSRQSVLASIPEGLDVLVRFWLVDTPLETCVARNASRERVVPEEVIRRMASRFTRPTEEEWNGTCIVLKTN